MDLEKLTAEERLIAEQAVLNFRSLNKACDDAKDGTVLAVVERPTLIQGRNSLRARGRKVCRVRRSGDGGFALQLICGSDGFSLHSRKRLIVVTSAMNVRSLQTRKAA